MMSPASQVGTTIRHDWTDAQIRDIYDLPVPDLLFKAQEIHRQHHDPLKVQLCTLLNIKTGGCSEDCGYCSQSARYRTHVRAGRLIDVDRVLEAARSARDSGSTRLCMGAAWREPRDGPEFEQVLRMVRGVRDIGLEACCTLGMLTREQARRLAEAGLTAYNHNLDTGPDYYERIVTTHTFEDRLRTLRSVQEAGIEVCCGGILGMGEDLADRVGLLRALAGFDPHPGSVPINVLVPVEGTPLAGMPPVEPLEVVRMVATTRIVMPRSRVRLSAGRHEMSLEAQTLCLLAGANSLFQGEALLTTANCPEDRDRALLEKLGMSALST
jgi:biotin synthase